MINFTWLAEQDTVHLPGYLIALAIGLLVGLERERKPSAKAGLRTCALVSLTGAVAAALAQTFSAPSILAVGLGAIAFMIVAAYYHHHEAFHDVDSGTTTIAAVIACYLLGALVMTGHVRVAVILSISITLLLHFKAELSGVARRLEQRDLVSILQFAVVAFVVLPLLPDRGYGPYAALNPRHIWSMVVLISGLSLVGYVALHLFGRQHGALLLGLLGGLVSSTATTITYSRHARDGASSIALAFDVILTANLVLLLRLAVLALVVAPTMLSTLAPVLGGALTAGAAAFVAARRPTGGAQELGIPRVTNPTELRVALGFGALYALVLVSVAWLVNTWGSQGIYVAASISGLLDVDAISLTNLRLYGLGEVSASQATIAIAIAVSANGVFKLGVIAVVGGRRLLRRCIVPLAAMLAGGALGAVLAT